MRLELGVLASALSFLVFQFHKGAIRTVIAQSALFAAQRFQFHKGAIRTPLRPIRDYDHAHFNSIKVRLEPSPYLITRQAKNISIP